MERVAVDYEELDPVTDMRTALDPAAGAAAAVANAVNDALRPFGATITEIPLTPRVILTALGRI